MINFMCMTCGIIEELFTRAVGKFQGDFGATDHPSERKALLVLFKIKKEIV
ncbi:unnamed protein product, partial [marine sediment metagenome]